MQKRTQGKKGAKKETRVLLVGVPNCGKSAVFCRLTGRQTRVGNWSGVTVERKEGHLRGRHDVVVIDLPGIFSLHPVTDEERVTIQVLERGNYDLIIQVLDTAAPQRSLQLTQALIARGYRLILACNRIDLLADGKFDPCVIEHEIGICTVALSARTGMGIAALKHVIEQELEDTKEHGAEPKKHACALCEKSVKKRRWEPEALARKITTGGVIHTSGAGPRESECWERTGNRAWRFERRLCTGVTAWLILAGVMGGLLTMTTLVFSLCGNLFDGMGDWCCTRVWEGLAKGGVRGFFTDFLGEGVLRGTLSALSFLPPLFFYYIMTAMLEDSGYFARVSFLCDPFLSAIGLGGQAILPFLLSAGCGVTGVCACRTLDDRHRRGCGGFCTWIPCHAKLPLIACVCRYCGFSLPALFLLVFIMIGAALLFAGVFSEKQTGFCTEMPRMTVPSIRVVLRSACYEAFGFLRRAGSLLALSSALVWLCSHTGFLDTGFGPCEIEKSLLAQEGKFLYPFFAPLGFASWETVAATLMGLFAKENTVVTLSLLGGTRVLGGSACATAFCLYNLFCPPCFAAVLSMRRELGRRAWLYLGVQLLVAAFAAATGWHLLNGRNV